VEHIVQVALRNREKVQAVLLGDDKCVPIMDGIDVEDGNDSLVFKENLCG
jgi:hypothetical protein